MSRPTISLACIAKNEEKNIPVLLKSVEGCFDEIHITDTGSTDDTIKIAQEMGANVHLFGWINDFSAARNASFEPIKTDYVMWMDLDDVLANKEAFLHFRDHVMNTADYWLANYHYAMTKDGGPACTFMRERIFRTDLGLKWRYFVHEGVVPESPLGLVKCNFVSTFAVQHRRSPEDLAMDKGRNLKLFRLNEDKLDPRMMYYYGKELFENNKPEEALTWFERAFDSKKLEPHDRILGYQYASYAAVQTGKLDRVIDYCHDGLKLAPNRAEYYCLLADTFIKQGKLVEAVPILNAAKHCHLADISNNSPSPIFYNKDLYGVYPANQLAKIYANIGKVDEAKREADEAVDKWSHPESLAIKNELNMMIKTRSTANDKVDCDEIVITCPPGGMYEWDGSIYRKKGIGGSETAAVEMAEWMHKLSGRPVKVFNPRAKNETIQGVEYVNIGEAGAYFLKNRPYAHIAWRHTIPLTDVKTYVWSHDLLTPGAESGNYYKLMVLSDFHRKYVQAIQGVSSDKLLVTKNGIDPARFSAIQTGEKKRGKVVFSSSPDRGVLRALRVMDRVVKEMPESEFHVYYGFDNLYKAGRGDVADKIKLEMVSRPYVHFHGNVDQKRLAKELATAQVWLYPTDFEETFCITALEMLACKVYPIVRKYGALQDTLREPQAHGWADVLDMDCRSESDIEKWSGAVLAAIKEEKWKRIEANPEDFSWRNVAQEWLELFEREKTECLPQSTPIMTQ